VLLVARDLEVQRRVVDWAWLLRMAEEEGHQDTIQELLGEMVGDALCMRCRPCAIGTTGTGGEAMALLPRSCQLRHAIHCAGRTVFWGVHQCEYCFKSVCAVGSPNLGACLKECCNRYHRS
jgi:hypothetical protein